MLGGLAAIDADTAWVTVSYDAIMPNPLGPFCPPIQILSSAIWKTADGGDTWSMQLYSLSPQRLGEIFVADGSTLDSPRARFINSRNTITMASKNILG
jgi:hypothetical protein